jgi:hypothetical protein
MKNSILLILLLCSILSCKKPNTGASGQVTDECSGTPIGNILVEVYTGDNSKSSTNRRSFIDSTRTDSNGKYEIGFRSSVFDNNYWVECKGFRSDYISKRENKKIDIKIPDKSQLSTLNIIIKNTNPFNAKDSIHIEVVRPNSSSPTYQIKFNYVGSAVDTNATINIDGCSPKIANIFWTVTKNNLTTTSYKSVTCINGATSTTQINY